MNNSLITGIHHVTALADDAQKNVDFYAGVLGLRIIKKTVNFDEPSIYHLYYGNEHGHPGTVMTFFPYPRLRRGRHGKGQLTVTSFSVHTNGLDYWLKRLKKFNVDYSAPQTRFGNEIFLTFKDIHGLGLELVFNNEDQRTGFTYGPVPLEHAIKGFYGVTLSVEGYERTAGLLLNSMNHDLLSESGNRFRYSASGKPGDYIDILCVPDALRGKAGSGTVHHVAFATLNNITQSEIREKLLVNGLNVTPVLDREYFRSIYFREPGGILFEVATQPPGFLIDEELSNLGKALKLPIWIEPARAEIEKVLQPIHFDSETFRELLS